MAKKYKEARLIIDAIGAHIAKYDAASLYLTAIATIEECSYDDDVTVKPDPDSDEIVIAGINDDYEIVFRKKD